MSVGVKVEKERVGLRLTSKDAHALRMTAARTRLEISEVVEKALRLLPEFRRERAGKSS